MQNGVLACAHVSETVWGKRAGPLEYREVRQDFLGGFGVNPDKVQLAGEDEQLVRFPKVAPICDFCLAEYRKSGTVSRTK